MKNFTYKDISKLAKVSISTVSRYYNGGYVSDETKKAIEDIIKKYNYTPNHGARLIRGHDNSIFIIVPQSYDNSITQVMNGIELSAKRSKERVIITYSGPSVKDYIETIKYANSWRPKSIVFFLPQYSVGGAQPANLEDQEKSNEEILQYIKENVTDCATFIYGQELDEFNCISINYGQAFYNLTKQFATYIEKGQKVVFALDTKLDDKQKSERQEGFEKACKELNLDYEVVLLSNKVPKQFTKFLNWLNRENIVNVVSSTHEVFINLVSSKDRNLRLTDISYATIYDTQQRFKCKIFIDYPQIGMTIVRILNNFKANKTVEKNIFRPKILFKNGH
ncbi:LacI family DNA-binding transcriptional regulator [Mycoplasmopsis adleri]|uniref:LacI family DNA-binding transcriptional regulator n=1 Tax=Mycoplasmopsis adleri TaxID=51362 RepID=UPI003873340A